MSTGRQTEEVLWLHTVLELVMKYYGYVNMLAYCSSDVYIIHCVYI